MDQYGFDWWLELQCCGWLQQIQHFDHLGTAFIRLELLYTHLLVAVHTPPPAEPALLRSSANLLSLHASVWSDWCRSQTWCSHRHLAGRSCTQGKQLQIQSRVLWWSPVCILLLPLLSPPPGRQSSRPEVRHSRFAIFVGPSWDGEAQCAAFFFHQLHHGHPAQSF